MSDVDRCTAKCLHGAKCWLVEGHRGEHQTTGCPEFGGAQWPQEEPILTRHGGEVIDPRRNY